MRALGAALDRLEDSLADRERVPALALVLTLPDCPEWAEPLAAGRCVRLIGGDSARRRRLLTTLRRRPDADLEGLVRLELRAGASEFIAEAVAGPSREVAAFGTRGDGKTWAALAAAILHADLHRAAGYPLPTSWLAATDTFRSHASKTLRSLMAPEWGGVWSLRDGGHVAVASVGGVELVHLDLFGVEDVGAMDKLRAEAHGLWFEEPAPSALLETSSGISEDAWGLALTSLRRPSPKRPALMTLNYPDEDHWSWRRFVTRRHPGTAYVRIAPGERATEADREAWLEALGGRQDLVRRLLLGEPGLVAMGEAVASGYRDELHVARQALEPLAHVELGIGWDAGHWPTTVIAQHHHGRILVYASLVTERAGTRQHLEQAVTPWLARHAPWALHRTGLLRHYVDPSMNTREQADTDQSPVAVIRQVLGGAVRDGAVTWPGRRDPLLALLARLTMGEAALAIAPTPDTEPLRRALAGRWFYPRRANGEVVKDLPEKNHPWSDLGDAFCYLVGGLAPSRLERGEVRVPAVRSRFDVLGDSRRAMR